MNELMEDLSAAFDAADDTEEQNDAVQQEEHTESPAAELAEDGPEGDDVRASESGVVSGSEEENQGQEGSGEQPDQQSADVDTPPKSMGAAAREAWKDAPKAIKDEFSRMDQRMEGLAQKYGADAQRAQQMDQALQPFQQLFAMNGGAQATITPILQTASVLQMGTPQQKAQMVANMIGQFGVDIKTLDSMLVGEQPEPSPQQNVEQIVNQALQQRDQQYMQQQNQQRQAIIGDEVAQFANDPKNEFYADVKDTMADLMEMAANRGRALTLDEAYQQACRLNDQVSSVLQGRASQQQVNQKRQAAASVQGSPSGSSSAPPDSLRAALEGAFENTGRM